MSAALHPAGPAAHPAGRARSALTTLTLTEAKLFLREPAALFWGVAFPMILLTVMGLVSSHPDPELGGLRLVEVFEPVLITLVSTVLAGQALPAILGTYRERGILRRLATTPVGPVRVLAAQLAVNAVVALVAVLLLVVVGRLAFDVPLPRQLLGFVATVVLLVATTLALGLAIAAVTPSARAAAALGTLLFFPLMFFAGLWVPRPLMPEVLLRIGDVTPLGAAVQALQDSVSGAWPQPRALGVLAAYAAVFAVVAVRFFRWQ